MSSSPVGASFDFPGDGAEGPGDECEERGPWRSEGTANVLLGRRLCDGVDGREWRDGFAESTPGGGMKGFAEGLSDVEAGWCY